MITPDQASALKPKEIKWLLSVEKKIDAALLDDFVGNSVRVQLPPAPSVRCRRLLLIRYREAWAIEVQSGPGGGYIDLTPRETYMDPPWPTSEMISEQEAKVAPTAWERINESTGEEEPV